MTGGGGAGLRRVVATAVVVGAAGVSVLVGSGSAGADALCDQMREQYGPGWPCISVPTYTPPPMEQQGPPTVPGQTGEAPAPNIGASPGEGPGVGNGTPIVPVPGTSGGVEVPGRQQAPATVVPDQSDSGSGVEVVPEPLPGAPDSGREVDPVLLPRTGEQAPGGTDSGVPLSAWLLTAAAALAVGYRRPVSFLRRGGATRGEIGPTRLVLIHDQSSPKTYRFVMDVPEGGTTKVNPDGSATVYDKLGRPVQKVARPWAFDAAGRPQKTWYEVDENGDLIQHVEPADDALYPILADPTEQEVQDAAVASALAGAYGGPSTSAAAAAQHQADWAAPESGSAASAGAAAGAAVGSGVKPPTDLEAATAVRSNETTGYLPDQDGRLVPATQYTDAFGRQVTEVTDPETGHTSVYSTGDYDGQIVDVYDADGTRILREERYSGGTLETGYDAGTTIRQYDYQSGRELILNYDHEGHLRNSSYLDENTNVLLRPGFSISATLVNPDADYDWEQIAGAIPQDFAESGQGQPTIINKGDQQLTVNPDGSSILADFGIDRAYHFKPGETDPSAVTHANGDSISPGEAYVGAVDGTIDGVSSLVGLGPYGAGEAWKSVASDLGTVIMYLPKTFYDGMTMMANPLGPYDRPDRESDLFEALTGVRPEYFFTSPGYAVGSVSPMIIPGGMGMLAKIARRGGGAVGGGLDGLPPHRTAPEVPNPSIPRELIPDDYKPYGDLTPLQFGEKYLGPGPDYHWKYPGPPDSPRDGFAQKPGGPHGEAWTIDPDYQPAPGMQFDRIGPLSGSYLSPKGVPFDQRALPPDALRGDYHVFTVGNVQLPEGWRLELGRIAPGFEQPGGGLQVKIHAPEEWVAEASGSAIKYLMKIGFFE